MGSYHDFTKDELIEEIGQLHARLAEEKLKREQADELIRQIHAAAGEGFDESPGYECSWDRCQAIMGQTFAYMTNTKIDPMYPSMYELELQRDEVREYAGRASTLLRTARQFITGDLGLPCQPQEGDRECYNRVRSETLQAIDALLAQGYPGSGDPSAANSALSILRAWKDAEIAEEEHENTCAYAMCEFRGCPHDVWDLMHNAKAARDAALASTDLSSNPSQSTSAAHEAKATLPVGEDASPGAGAGGTIGVRKDDETFYPPQRDCPRSADMGPPPRVVQLCL